MSTKKKLFIAWTLVIVACFVVYRAYFFKPEPAPQEIIERNKRMRESHWKDVAAIHQGGERIREGDTYFKLGKYAEAAAAYKQAYDIGERSDGGILLATAYEKIGQCSKAISLLNEMIQNDYLSESGVQMARLMISRMESTPQPSIDRTTSQRETLETS